MAQMKYCGNCMRWVTPTTGIRWGIFILLLILVFPLAFVYAIWKMGGGKCPMCNSKNWSIPPKEEKEKESK